MTVRMQQRRGTAAQWTSANPVLGQGELGVETDTLKLKMGNGTTAWNSLSYVLANTNDVGTNAIQNGAVTNAKLGADSVTTDKILNGTIVDADINANAAIAQSKVSGLPDALALKADKATVGNLLTDNQASGTDALGDTAGFENGGSGATLASTTDQAYQGSRSLKTTASGAGNASLFTTTGTGGIPVTPGQTYTATVTARSAAEASPFACQIAWFTAAGAYISSSASADATTSTSTWTTKALTAVAPATAAFASVAFACASTAASAHYVDALGIWKGTNGQWAMPGTPIVGQSPIASNGAVHLSGTGAPESVVTAAPGSTWLQTDATNDVKGWIRWVKATGTGSTGWVAGPEADTGWRNIVYTSGEANWIAGYLGVRRVGNIVTCDMSNVGMTTLGSKIYELPAGFSSWYRLVSTIAREGAATGFPTWFSLSHLSVGDYAMRLSGTHVSTHRYSGQFIYHTFDAWPSSLPGSAV